jgi:DNA-binding beta-propeller fold protein YncE
MSLRLAFALLLSCVIPAFAGQAPGAANSPDIAISHRDRFYTSDQFSNTVSVIDPVDNKLLGVRPGLTSFDPATFCVVPIPNQKRSLSIAVTPSPNP